MDNRRVAEQYAKASQDKEWEELGGLMHDEFVAHYPQSGEIFRGRESYLTMLANFPEGLGEADFSSVKGGSDMIVKPSFQPFYGYSMLALVNNRVRAVIDRAGNVLRIRIRHDPSSAGLTKGMQPGV